MDFIGSKIFECSHSIGDFDLRTSLLDDLLKKYTFSMFFCVLAPYFQNHAFFLTKTMRNGSELLENTMLRGIYNFTHYPHIDLFQIDSLVSEIRKLISYSARCHGARTRRTVCFQSWNTFWIVTVRLNLQKSSKYWNVWVTVPMVILNFRR